MIKNINNPFVSVVTPFYNTDEYLAECIESVLAQTYQNWEYILVNNCSTDKSYEIAKNYAKKDKRIRLINNEEFMEQVNNYNNALRKISPESIFCKIVQADDWIFPECLSSMVSVAKGDKSVGIVGSYSLQGSKVINDGLPYQKKQTFLGRYVCKQSLIIDGRQIFGSPTTTLFRSDIIRNRVPFYSEKDLFEDTDACYEILENYNFGFVYQVLSYVRVNNESVSSNVTSFDPAWYLSKFLRHSKFGKKYLTNGEFQQRMQVVKDAYFRYLAYSALCGKGKEFWAYHRNGLATVGYDLKISSLAKYFVLEILDILFNPKATLGRVIYSFLPSKKN